MKLFTSLLLLFCFPLTSCDDSFFSGPRKVNWKKEWSENEPKLKALTKDILFEGINKYSGGNNDFPENFKYPFDDGFYITYKSSAQKDSNKILSISFYLDRGILDHYSAFIFTNDTTEIKELNVNVANGGNDFLIEPNWYIIND